MKNKLFFSIINFLLSVFTYVTFIKMDVLPAYNILSLIIFVLIILLYGKKLSFEKKLSKANAILSVIFSIAIIFGRNFYAYYNKYTVNIWKENFSLNSLVYLVGLIPLFYTLLNILYDKICTVSINEIKYSKKENIIFAIISFVLMMGVWTVYLLNFFPGTLSPDSISEYSMFVNGLNITRDHHPVLHILFMALFYKIGYSIFGTANMGVFVVSLAQMIIMSAIFTYALMFLRKRNCPRIVSYLILVFFAFSPMHGYYSVTMWKDVLFAGFFLLLTLECYKLYENRNNLTFKKMISFTVISLITVFMRNNAIYAYFIIAIALLIILIKHFKVLISSFLVVLIVFFVVKGPIFNSLGIKKSSSAEYIGMPLQQMGRIVAKEELLTEKEQKLIDDLLPRETIATAYNPVVSDGIKFHSDFNIEAFNDNKLEYAKTYIGLLFKHFAASTEAYCISTLGYWYPNIEYWSVSSITWDNDLDIYIDSKTNNTVHEFLREIERRDIPIMGMQWSIGLCVWIIAILAVFYIKRNGYKAIIPFLPCITVWLTMLIASPVWGEFRYVYGFFTTVPVLICLFFIYDKVLKKEENKQQKEDKK